MDNSTITTISIRNFKGIEDLQLNAKKLNAIIGKCGSGKSSLLDAIRFALTGKAGKEVIRKGCREASVVLRFSDNSTIERIRRTSENISKCNGKSSTKRSLDEFQTARNMNPCWIESLCSVDWFAGLSSKDLNNFFMTISTKDHCPLVYILTPSYNCGQYIYRLLNSVLTQTYPNIEMTVIDDGSTDNTKDIIISYQFKFAARCYKLNYVYQNNQGLSSTINNGLKLVHGDFLIWPDADD